MYTEIFKQIFFNISMLLLLAWGITHLKIIKDFLVMGNKTFGSKVLMAFIFGGIGIIATYIGLPIDGAIANARVIGVISGGILGGPIVGVLSGLIAGIHRFAIDIGGFTAVACAVSTILEGLLGGLMSAYIYRSKKRWLSIWLTAVFAEILQMAVILIIAKPFESALALVQVIWAPMILFNSVGILFFISIFDSIFEEQNYVAAKRIKLAFQIAEKCLPFMRKGIENKEGLIQVCNTILEMSHVKGVVITNRKEILAMSFHEQIKTDFKTSEVLPDIAVKTIDKTGGNSKYIAYEQTGKYLMICVPLFLSEGNVVGTLMLYVEFSRWTVKIESEFAQGLAGLFSTQLELSQLEYQRRLRENAEFKALQSQINPHFLFNALSTISMFCREKPDRARELLINLSDCFRKTLRTDRDLVSLKDEMNHVRAYLELEKARFEERLTIIENIDEKSKCVLPAFTIQPIVENAIKHGAMKNADGGIVKIEAVSSEDETVITIEDNGKGFPKDVLKDLFAANRKRESIGLLNVHKRLISIYGEERGLSIKSSNQGSAVQIRIPN